MGISELKEKIKTIGEPWRVSHGNIRHRLDDIIIIGLCTIICPSACAFSQNADTAVKNRRADA